MSNDPLSLVGRSAVITGSGRNIGRAVAHELASHGANVLVNVRSNEVEAHNVQRELEEYGVRAAVVIGDACRKETVERIAEVGQGVLGGIDIVVSNASQRLYRLFEETSDDEWEYHLNQQLTASWHLAKSLTPGMVSRGWGRIIHINGPDGYVGGPTRIPHAVGKAGLRALTKSLAGSLGGYGITVNDVTPSCVDTVRDPATHPREDSKSHVAGSREAPIGRDPSVEEVAWACAFLCAERSAAITGVNLAVDGGRWMF